MAYLREYRATDRPALYEVCLRTGADGGDATDLYQVPTLLAEVYVGPYLSFEPNNARVVDNDGVAAGYVLCAPDTASFEQRCERDWWPTLRERYPLGTFPAGSLDEEVTELIHRPPRTDRAVLVDYPAHLHIDLVPEVQGGGLGGALIRDLLERMRAAGVRGIHLGVSTANVRAIGFYEHLGFSTFAVDGGQTLMGARLNAPNPR